MAQGSQPRTSSSAIAHPREGTSDLQPSAPPFPLRLTDPQQESSRLKGCHAYKDSVFLLFLFLFFFFLYGSICPHLHSSSFQKSSKVLMVSKYTVDEFREADAIPLQSSTLQTQWVKHKFHRLRKQNTFVNISEKPVWQVPYQLASNPGREVHFCSFYRRHLIKSLSSP